MNGLTAANVDHLTEAINRSVDRYKASGKKETAAALEDLLCAINEMRRYNATQPSRRDRVGDECWFRTGGGDWQKGVIRSWIPRDGAVIEDVESKRIFYAWEIYFTTEAPA